MTRRGSPDEGVNRNLDDPLRDPSAHRFAGVTRERRCVFRDPALERGEERLEGAVGPRGVELLIAF